MPSGDGLPTAPRWSARYSRRSLGVVSESGRTPRSRHCRLHAQEQGHQAAGHPLQHLHPLAAAPGESPGRHRTNMGNKGTGPHHPAALTAPVGHLPDLLQGARNSCTSPSPAMRRTLSGSRALPAPDPHPFIRPGTRWRVKILLCLENVLLYYNNLRLAGNGNRGKR